MITRLYLLSTILSRSSIGGLVMPSAPGALDATAGFSSASSFSGLGFSLATRTTYGRPLHSLGASPSGVVVNSQQGYQLAADLPNRRVHEGDVELLLGRQLLACRGETAADHLGRFGAPPGQAAYELVPGRRRQEHQQRLGHRLPYLTGALQVDLEQGRYAGREVLQHRAAR